MKTFNFIFKIYNLIFIVVFIPVALIYVLSKFKTIKAIVKAGATEGEEMQEVFKKVIAEFSDADKIIPPKYLQTFISTILWAILIRYILLC